LVAPAGVLLGDVLAELGQALLERDDLTLVELDQHVVVLAEQLADAGGGAVAGAGVGRLHGVAEFLGGPQGLEAVLHLGQAQSLGLGGAVGRARTDGGAEAADDALAGLGVVAEDAAHALGHLRAVLVEESQDRFLVDRRVRAAAPPLGPAGPAVAAGAEAA